MWEGLKQRHSSRAVGTALSWVCALPWGVFLVLLTLGTVFDRFRPSWFTEDQLILVWLIIGLVNDLVLGFYARGRLLRDFREVATRRFAGGAKKQTLK
jgi:hypothetical protein